MSPRVGKAAGKKSSKTPVKKDAKEIIEVQDSTPEKPEPTLNKLTSYWKRATSESSQCGDSVPGTPFTEIEGTPPAKQPKLDHGFWDLPPSPSSVCGAEQHGPCVAGSPSMSAGCSQTIPPSSPEVPLTCMLEEVMNDDKDALHSMLKGVDLKDPQDQCKKLEENMMKSTPTWNGNENSGGVQLEGDDERQLREAIEGDRIDPRSGIGQRIADMIKRGPEKLREYKTLSRRRRWLVV